MGNYIQLQLLDSAEVCGEYRYSRRDLGGEFVDVDDLYLSVQFVRLRKRPSALSGKRSGLLSS